MVLSNPLFFQYCDSNISLFSITPCKVIAPSFWSKRSHVKKWSKEVKSDNFCYRKVRRAIIKLRAIEKCPIWVQYCYQHIWKFNVLVWHQKFVSYFGGTNNIFRLLYLQIICLVLKFATRWVMYLYKQHTYR